MAAAQGKYGFHFGYRELPERVFDTTSSVFGLSGNDTLTLPGSWVPAPQTSGMTALSSSLSSQNIESDRQIIEFGANYLPTSHFGMFVEFRQQQKDGVNIFGGSTFTQASLLPRPLDHETNEVDLGVRYASEPRERDARPTMVRSSRTKLPALHGTIRLHSIRPHRSRGRTRAGTRRIRTTNFIN